MLVLNPALKLLAFYRQSHVCGLELAAAMSGARLEGNKVKSTRIKFTSKLERPIIGASHSKDIGTAG